MEMLIYAALTAIAILVIMVKTNIRRWLAYEVTVDVGVTAGLAAIGAATGSFIGVMMGVVAGLIFSIVLTFLKKILGCERLTLKGWKREPGSWRITADQVREIRDTIIAP